MSDDLAYCINGCGLPAVGERPYSVEVTAAGDLEEVVELVCVECTHAD